MAYRENSGEAGPRGLQTHALICAQSSAPIERVQSGKTHPERVRTPFEALSSEAQVRLRELMTQLSPLSKLITRAQSTRTGNSIKPKKASARHRDIRLPKPGDMLSRDYKGRPITVSVLESGFVYDGCRYRSLSAIAKKITGSHWNGLLFFGIVRQER